MCESGTCCFVPCGGFRKALLTVTYAASLFYISNYLLFNAISSRVIQQVFKESFYFVLGARVENEVRSLHVLVTFRILEAYPYFCNYEK